MNELEKRYQIHLNEFQYLVQIFQNQLYSIKGNGSNIKKHLGSIYAIDHYIRHISLIKLLPHSQLAVNEPIFWDKTSVANLIRQQLEGLITFHYLFNTNNEEWEFRLKILQYHSKINQLNANKYIDNKEEIDFEPKNLEDSDKFEQLGSKIRKKILNGETIFIHPKIVYAKSIGMRATFYKGIYNYFSDFTHLNLNGVYHFNEKNELGGPDQQNVDLFCSLLITNSLILSFFYQEFKKLFGDSLPKEPERFSNLLKKYKKVKIIKKTNIQP